MLSVLIEANDLRQSAYSIDQLQSTRLPIYLSVLPLYICKLPIILSLLKRPCVSRFEWLFLLHLPCAVPRPSFPGVVVHGIMPLLATTFPKARNLLCIAY